MGIRHHPSDELLISFAAGSVGRVAAPVIAAHCDRCADCRAKVLEAEAVGGALLENMPLTPLSPGALERGLERLDRLPREDVSDPQLFDSLGQLIRPTRIRLHWVAPGFRYAVLLRSPPETLRLLELRPGTALPRHTHQGKELACVLRGAL